jgi:hypothetical protein
MMAEKAEEARNMKEKIEHKEQKETAIPQICAIEFA